MLGRTIVAATTLAAVCLVRRESLGRPSIGLVVNGMILAVHWVAFFLAVKIASVALALLGYAYQRTLIAAAVERASLVASLLVTFGVALMARNLMQIGFSPDVRSISTAYSFAGLSLGPLRIDLVRAAGLLTSLVLLSGLAVLLKRTSFGRAIRATAQQPVGAALSGIDVRHVHGLTFGLGAAFAGAPAMR